MNHTLDTKVCVFHAVCDGLDVFTKGLPTKSPEWNSLLRTLPPELSDSEKMACVQWMEKSWKEQRKPMSERVLHEMEREFIDFECWRFINYCLQKRFVNFAEMEHILEQSLASRPLPLSSFDLEQNVAHFWFKNTLQKQKLLQ